LTYKTKGVEPILLIVKLSYTNHTLQKVLSDIAGEGFSVVVPSPTPINGKVGAGSKPALHHLEINYLFAIKTRK
jgi:hypothetical protein